MTYFFAQNDSFVHTQFVQSDGLYFCVQNDRYIHTLWTERWPAICQQNDYFVQVNKTMYKVIIL